MEHILEHQLKELYSLWNGINGLYTKWAQKRGMSYYSVFVLYAIYNSEGKCCPKGYATSGPCQSRPSAAS